MKKDLLSAFLLSSALLTVAHSSMIYNIETGWQLLGAVEDIDIAKFKNDCVKNIFTYDSSWTSLENITTIKEGKGFWVNGLKSCQIDLNATISNSSSSSSSSSSSLLDTNSSSQKVTMENNQFCNYSGDTIKIENLVVIADSTMSTSGIQSKTHLVVDFKAGTSTATVCMGSYCVPAETTQLPQDQLDTIWAAIDKVEIEAGKCTDIPTEITGEQNVAELQGETVWDSTYYFTNGATVVSHGEMSY